MNFDWSQLFQGNNGILILLAVFLFKDQIYNLLIKTKPPAPAPSPAPAPVPVPAPVPATPDRPLIDALVTLIPTLLPILLPLITESLKPKIEATVKEQLAASK